MFGCCVMFIMYEILYLFGGYKFLNFVYKLVDGLIRYVQIYVGLIEIYGDKFMLCIVYDIIE